MATLPKSAKAVTVGDPVDPDKQPSAAGLWKYLESLEAVSSSGLSYFVDDLTDLPTASTVVNGVFAAVINDSTLSNRGIYQEQSNAWVKVADLPAAFSSTDAVILTAGGTGDAVTATANRAFSAAAFAETFTMQIASVNTGAVTVAIDGGTAYALVDSQGTALASGAFPVGLFVDFRFDGTSYRLVSGSTAVTILAAAQAAQTVAETARTAAEAAKTETEAQILDVTADVEQRDRQSAAIIDDPAEPLDRKTDAVVDDNNTEVLAYHVDGRVEFTRDNEFTDESVEGRSGLTDNAGNVLFEVSSERLHIYNCDDTSAVYDVGAAGSRVVWVTGESGPSALTAAADDGDCFAASKSLDGRHIRFVSNVTGELLPTVMSMDGKNRMILGDAVLRFFAILGQSLSTGKAGTTATATNTTPLKPGRNLMFIGPDDPASPRILTDPDRNPDAVNDRVADASLGELIDLKEAVTLDSGETLASRMAEQLQDASLWNDRRAVVAEIFGVGGASAAFLMPDQEPWHNLRRAVFRAKEIAQSLGMGFEFSGLIWEHGHSNGDATEAKYTAFLDQLEAGVGQLVTDLGQTTTPVLALSSLALSRTTFVTDNSSEVPLAQANWAAGSSSTVTRVHSHPGYVIPIGADNTHPDAGGYEDIGHYYGRAIRRAILGNNSFFRATGATGAGTNQVTVNLAGAVGAVAIDTSYVTDPGDNGFIVRDSGGTVTISSVSVVNGNVQINLAATLGSSPEVEYAKTGTNEKSGPTSGPRGNVRDSAGASENLPSGQRADNYLPAFLLSIT